MAGKTTTTAYRRSGFRRYRWPGSARGGVSITSAAERVRVFAPASGHANRLDEVGVNRRDEPAFDAHGVWFFAQCKTVSGPRCSFLNASSTGAATVWRAAAS